MSADAIDDYFTEVVRMVEIPPLSPKNLHICIFSNFHLPTFRRTNTSHLPVNLCVEDLRPSARFREKEEKIVVYDRKFGSIVCFSSD